MTKWPAPGGNSHGNGNGKHHTNGTLGGTDTGVNSKARDLVTALLGCLRLADAGVMPVEQRAQFTAAASRQATLLRNLFPGRLLVVVARDKAGQEEQIRRAFPADAEVQVIVDRRHGERRRGGVVAGDERRRGDRRQQRVDDELRLVGVAVLPAGRPTPVAVSGGPINVPRTGSSSEYRVLLIDDDPAVVQLLSNYFELDKRYTVSTALSGEKGLAAFEAERPDVVLLDITMPGMDGLEVLRRMRAIDSSIPVIMVTGASYQQSGEALRHGAFAYIPKPFDLRYIDHLISLVTERKRSRR